MGDDFVDYLEKSGIVDALIRGTPIRCKLSNPPASPSCMLYEQEAVSTMGLKRDQVGG